MNRRNGLRLEFDWQDPGGARGEELRATWASLAIYIDCQPVTEVLDERTRSVRNRIYLPLFPLAEWIADNWWFLQAETEIAGSVFDFGFERRHSFQWARDGSARINATCRSSSSRRNGQIQGNSRFAVPCSNISRCRQVDSLWYLECAPTGNG